MVVDFDKQLEEIFNTLEVSKIHRGKTRTILSLPEFKKASTVEEFKERVEEYYEMFRHLRNYAKRPYGRGELIPYLSIEGAQLGAAKEKDITVGDKVLEVKELDRDLYFDTATEGKISGSDFSMNLEMFFKYITGYTKDEKWMNLVDYFRIQFSKGGLSGGFLEKLRSFIEDLEVEKPAFELIKIRGKNHIIKFGEEAQVRVGPAGYLRTTLEPATRREVAQFKLYHHPWVLSKGKGIFEDLDKIQTSYFKNIDYLFILKKQEVRCMTREEALLRFKPYRIAFGNLHLRLID